MTYLHKVGRLYHFESAHWLPRVPDEHKCRRLHGHNYELLVNITADITDQGWVIDFWDVDKIVDPLIERVDHRCLNDIPGLGNPTAELIATWFHAGIVQKLYTTTLRPLISGLKVRIYETKTCYAEYPG